jgi:hypothetical protein
MDFAGFFGFVAVVLRESIIPAKQGADPWQKSRGHQSAGELYILVPSARTTGALQQVQE